jgi:hypothetical protein
MPEARRPAIDEALALGSYGFIVLELAYGDERDLSGLVRYRLEGVLPRGIEGLRYYFRRIGRTKRFIVTLVKEPAPELFVPARTCLPFALQRPEGAGRTVEWVSRNATFVARYDDRNLASVEAVAKDEEGAAADRPAPVGQDAEVPTPERRAALSSGPSLQQPLGREDLVWKIAAAALGLALAAQLAFVGGQAISTRESRLASLGEQIAVLSKFAVADSGQGAAAGPVAPDTGLQSRADEIQQSVSRRWLAGCYLEKWKLKAGVLRLEGWGPDALKLLASLRSDPELAALELASRKEEGGYETFAFEGKVGHD